MPFSRNFAARHARPLLPSPQERPSGDHPHGIAFPDFSVNLPSMPPHQPVRGLCSRWRPPRFPYRRLRQKCASDPRLPLRPVASLKPLLSLSVCIRVACRVRGVGFETCDHSVRDQRLGPERVCSSCRRWNPGAEAESIGAGRRASAQRGAGIPVSGLPSEGETRIHPLLSYLLALRASLCSTPRDFPSPEGATHYSFEFFATPPRDLRPMYPASPMLDAGPLQPHLAHPLPSLRDALPLWRFDFET